MRAAEAQERMFALEAHDQEWNVEEFLTWLLSLDDDPDTAGKVMKAEVDRASLLLEGHYARVTDRITVMNPKAILTIGFQQGATFAAAALGREPYGGGGDG